MIEKTTTTVGYQFRVEKVELKEYTKMRSQLKSLHISELERVDSGVVSQIMKLYDAPEVGDLERYKSAEAE